MRARELNRLEPLLLAPPAKGRRRRFSRRSALRVTAPPPTRQPPARRRRRSRRRANRLQLAVLIVVVAAAGGMIYALQLWRAGDVAFAADLNGAVVGAADLDRLSFSVTAANPALLDGASVRIDGIDVTGQAEREGERLVYEPLGPTDGRHRVVISVPQPLPRRDVAQSWSFRVDTRPPALELGDVAGVLAAGQPVTIAGGADSGSVVTVDGEPVTLTETGTFSVSLEQAPSRPVTVVATDAAGNASERSLELPVVAFQGPEDGAVVGAQDLAGLVFGAEANQPGLLREATVFLDDKEVTGQAERADGRLVYTPSGLDDAAHDVRLVIPGAAGARPLEKRWSFTTDTTPPSLELTVPEEAVAKGEPASFSGTVEAGSSVTVAGDEVSLVDGAFSVDYAKRPAEPVVVVATDAAGNAVTRRVGFTGAPWHVPVDEIRALHVSFWAWNSAELREPILEMAENGQINTVQLDLKDESGMVGYTSKVPLANEIGASAGIYDLEAAVRELHDRGIHVIGRIVAFRDPVLAEHAWEAGNRDRVLQTPSGGPYAGYGGFSNFAHPAVRQYNVAVAEEAAAAGVDAILWDYIRRPDGPLENLVIPGLAGSPQQAIASFLAEADAALKPYDVGHGASVYGIAASRPEQIAQNIPMMAEHVDYISPMVYPSHWARGEYDVAHPNAQPYDIVHESLLDFKNAVKGTDARIVPWLQDFSLGVDYGVDEVRAQIEAAADVGIDEWLMWDAAVTYTEGAYRP